MDFAKVTANVDSDIGSMTRVQEDYLVADKQCLDPVSFVKIKIEVKVSRIIFPCFLPCVLCQVI